MPSIVKIVVLGKIYYKVVESCFQTKKREFLRFSNVNSER